MTVWKNGYEKKIVSLTNGSVTMYLSLSVAKASKNLKIVSYSKKSITISGKNFSTTLGRNKMSYSVSGTVGNTTIKSTTFIGTNGYGLGISFISPIYSTQNKKIANVSVNIVLEATYAVLGTVAVTVAGACVVIPAVVPVAKQMIQTFSVLAQPKILISYLTVFYSLINNAALQVVYN
jgi:hypothetical protein